MAPLARVVWDPVFTKYDFGAEHPMAPIRLDLTARLCEAFGLFDHDDIDVLQPAPVSDEDLETVHDPAYIAEVKRASQTPQLADARFGLGTDDDPAFPGMHEASARIVEGTRHVCEAVWNGAVNHGVNFCGGMHHAMPERASGFCIYNDIGVGIKWLLAHGAERVAYVDIDVHHGDGVEKIFWDDPRVLTVSIHESGRALFPGTGWATDIGGPAAEGHAVNISLPPGLGDSGWLRAFNAGVLPVVKAFKPQIIVSQHGADTHAEDPLAHLHLSVEAQRDAAIALHRLAHQVCDGRWVALGGGGYAVVDVVPRAWTHLTAIAAHRPILPKTLVPESWLAAVHDLTGKIGPTHMGDLGGELIWWKSWDLGFDPSNALDRAVMATRQAIFPLHGLDVWFD
ncbi:MAG: acetoin utilization protein AcuC [Dermatophilaceae bacterium]